VRFVYNYALKLCADTWYRRQTRIGYNETYASLMVLKGMQQYRFLSTVPEKPLRQSLRRLDADFLDFRAGRATYPKFRTADDGPATYAIAISYSGGMAPAVKVEYPVDTRCFDCGYFLPSPPVTAEWICPECGVIQNTAINTARNAEAVQAALRANGED
jgi:transposase